MVHEGVIRRSAAALSDTTLTGTSAAVTKLIAAVLMMAKLMSAVLEFLWVCAELYSGWWFWCVADAGVDDPRLLCSLAWLLFMRCGYS